MSHSSKKIKDFSEFVSLNESTQNKTIVFSFGRFQPPTIGHKLLVDKVVSLAKKYRADHVIYASRTQDKKSNPLNVNVKVDFLNKIFPNVNFKAANDDVRTFIEVLKTLHKEGYKKVYMIAGSDRLSDYQKIFDKYNGGDDFAFDILEAISAGERDPDAEGASGMSGTKMRQAAINNDFASFRKGIPNTLSDADTKKLMQEIRKIKSLKEYFNYFSEELLSEGVNDKAIFKAVFLAGGPGSGKDYVLRKTLEGHGFVEINSDNAFEYLLDKYNLDKKMPDNEEEQRNAVRARAKSIKELKERLAIQGRNGLILNGTGEDAEKIASLKIKLEGLGYDTQMLFVHTKNEVSQQRNIERGERGGRTVNEKIRQEKWDNAQKNRKNFQNMFEDGYVEFDNSEDLRNVDSETVQAKEAQLLDIFKRFRKFSESPVESPEAKEWIQTEKQMISSLKVNPPPEQQNVDQSAPAEPQVSAPASAPTQTGQPAPVGASQQSIPQNNPVAQTQQSDQSLMDKARRMGLEYYGFGRFGKKGTVTHKEVNGELKQLDPMHEQFKDVKTPKEISMMHNVKLIDILRQLKMGIKVEREHTSSEKLARKIALQHLAEIPNYYTKLKAVEKKNIKESYSFSGTDAKELLTLGMGVYEEVQKEASCKRITDSYFTNRKKIESYDSPSAESPGVFGYSKDDWRKGRVAVGEMDTGDVSINTIAFQKDDERQKSGLEPFSTFKAKNPI